MNAQNTIESLSEKTNNLWSTHLNILAVVKTNYTEFEIKTILDLHNISCKLQEKEQPTCKPLHLHIVNILDEKKKRKDKE